MAPPRVKGSTFTKLINYHQDTCLQLYSRIIIETLRMYFFASADHYTQIYITKIQARALPTTINPANLYTSLSKTHRTHLNLHGIRNSLKTCCPPESHPERVCFSGCWCGVGAAQLTGTRWLTTLRPESNQLLKAVLAVKTACKFFILTPPML